MSDLPTHPDAHTHARRDGPWTSHAAARQLGDQSSIMHALLRCYALGPRTVQELADETGYTTWQCSKRVSDLVQAGLIEDTDYARPGRSGRAQLVRAITEAGYVALWEVRR